MRYQNILKRIDKLEKALVKKEQETQATQPRWKVWEDFALATKIRSGNSMVSFRPYSYQKLLHSLIQSHEAVDIIKVRQMGVTQAITSFFLFEASQNQGYTSAIFSLSQPDSSQISLRARTMLDSSGLKASNDNVGYLEVSGAGSLHFKNSSERGSRGLDSISHILIDESAFQTNPGAILAASSPSMAMVRNPCVLTCSTPNGKSGWFYDRLTSFNPDIEDICSQVAKGNLFTLEPGAFHQSKDGHCLVILHWRCHPRYKQIEQEHPGGYLAYRQQQSGIDEVVLHQEHNLCFAANTTGVFLAEDVYKGIQPIPKSTGIKKYFIGVDPNFGGSDYCAAVVLAFVDNCCFVVNWYYKKKQPSQQNIFEIGKLIHKYRPKNVSVESNAGGAIYADSLDALGLAWVRRVHTTRESKLRNIERLNVALQRGKLIYRDNCPIISELLALQHNNGKICAAPGKHDDFVMATTLALEGILTPSRGLDLSEFPTYGKAEN